MRSKERGTAGPVVWCPLLNRRHFQSGLPSLARCHPEGITVEHLPFDDIGLAEEYLARNGDRLLAVVIEPVQGDAAVLVPPPGFLRRLTDRAHDCGALVVTDELLTFGKTGAPLAMADEQVAIPTDIAVIGKTLGMGAVPISMVIARRELAVRSSGAVGLQS